MREVAGMPEDAGSARARRGAHVPATPPDGIAAVATAGDLWADDPFAAPRRRHESLLAPAPEPVAEPALALVAAVALDAPATDGTPSENAVVGSVNAEVPASVTAAPRKRRATRKTLPA